MLPSLEASRRSEDNELIGSKTAKCFAIKSGFSQRLMNDTSNALSSEANKSASVCLRGALVIGASSLRDHRRSTRILCVNNVSSTVSSVVKRLTGQSVVIREEICILNNLNLCDTADILFKYQTVNNF